MAFNKQLDKGLEAFRARLAPNRGLKAALARVAAGVGTEEKPEAAPSLRRAREIFRDAQRGPERDKLKPGRSEYEKRSVLDVRYHLGARGGIGRGADFGDKGLSEVPAAKPFSSPHALSPSEISLPKKSAPKGYKFDFVVCLRRPTTVPDDERFGSTIGLPVRQC